MFFYCTETESVHGKVGAAILLTRHTMLINFSCACVVPSKCFAILNPPSPAVWPVDVIQCIHTELLPQLCVDYTADGLLVWCNDMTVKLRPYFIVLFKITCYITNGRRKGHESTFVILSVTCICHVFIISPLLCLTRVSSNDLISRSTCGIFEPGPFQSLICKQRITNWDVYYMSLINITVPWTQLL